MDWKDWRSDGAPDEFMEAVRYKLIAFGIGVVMVIVGLLWSEASGGNALNVGLFLGGGVLCFLVITSGSKADPLTKRFIGGAKVRALSAVEPGDGLLIGSARWPRKIEPQHLLVEGANGTGKTQLLKQLVNQLRERGDTVVIVDLQYDMFNTFGRQGDVILSPFDERSPGWLPLNEIRRPSDWDALAETLISKGEGNSAEWNAMARAYFSAIARGYQREIEEAGLDFDHNSLFNLLTSAPVEDVAPFLQGSAAASLVDNEKGLTNIRMSFFEGLKFWQDLKPGAFSLRDWVALPDHERPSIFIPHQKRTLAAQRTLIATWIDQIVKEACDLGENRNRRVFIIIDELASLGKIPSLEEATAELRKTGFCIVVGVQNIEQIEQRYTRTGARTINSNLSSKVFFRVNDPEAAERISRTIGTARLEVTNVNHSTQDTGKRSASTAVSEKEERLVLASEVSGLPNLHAFVKFAELSETLKTTIPIYQGKE